MTRARRTKLRYRWVNTTTLKGLKTAERLHANGWKMLFVGLFTTLFEKRSAS